MKIFRSFPGILGLALSMSAMSHAQILDHPITAPLGITVDYECDPYDTTMIDLSVADTSISLSPYLYGEWTSTGQFPANLRPGKSYDFVVGGEYVVNYRIRFNPPAGYAVFVNDVEQRTREGRAITWWGDTDIIRVRIEGGSGSSSMPAGECTDLNPGRMVWSVGLGDLSNGRPAGSICFREDGFSGNLGTRASLYYDSAISEVDVLLTGSGQLRQVYATQALVDVVDLAGGGVGLNFYPQASFGMSGGVYNVSGHTAFARFELIKGGANEFTLRKIVGGKTWQSRVTRVDNGGEIALTHIDWTEDLNSPRRLEERTISSDGLIEDVRVKESAAATVVSVTRKVYAHYEWGVELRNVIRGYGSSNLTTTYTYHPNSDGDGQAGKVATVTHPDGSWSKYEYYNDQARLGLLKAEYAPFQNAPATHAGASTAVGRYTFRDYSADHTGALTRPARREEWINGALVGKRITSYLDGSFLGQATVTATITDYADPTNTKVTTHTAFRADADQADHWLTELPLATATASGQASVHAYTRGWFNPSQRTFTPNPGDVHVEELIIHGSATQTPGSIPLSSLGGRAFATVYVVPGKSTMEVNIRGTSGVIYYSSASLADGSGNFVKTNGLLMPHLDGRWKQYEWDDFYRYHNRWTWASGQIVNHTGDDGTVTGFEYDIAGRLFRQTRLAAAASGSFPAMPAIPVEFEYDADHRLRFRREGPAASTSAVSEWRYDTAGRRVFATEPGSDAVIVSYPTVAQVKYELPGAIAGAPPGTRREVVETHYLDGSLQSRTGNATVPLYATIDFDGSNPLQGKLTQKSALDSGYAAMWSKAELDWLGRATRQIAPTYGGSTRFVDTTYCGCGRIEKISATSGTTRLAPPRHFLYDAVGSLEFQVVDFDDNGLGDMLTRDGVTKLSRSFAYLDNAWWLVETSSVLPTHSSNAERKISETRTKLTGLSSTLASVVKTIDGPGNVTTVTTTVDPAARRRTVTIDRPDATTDETVVHINGLLHQTLSAGGVSETREYDGHGRVTRVQGRSYVQARFTYHPGTYLVHQKLNYYYATDTYAYDVAGRVASHADAHGKADYFGYDAAGRVTHRWGASIQPMQIGYDSAGRRTDLWTWSDGSGWDALTGLATGTGWSGATWPDTTGLTARHTSWAYQPTTGLLTTRTDPANHQITYQYNARGQASKRTEVRSGSETIVTDIAYWEAGDADPVYDVYPTGALRRIDYSHANTTDLVFRYDRLGRIARVTDATGDRAIAYQDSEPAAGVGANLQPTTETFVGNFYGSTYGSLTRAYETAGVARGRYAGFSMGGSLGYGYQYGGASGRLDRITAAGFTDQVYGYETGSDLVKTVTAGSWTYESGWQHYRTTRDGVYYRWNGENRGQLVSDTDWVGRRLNNKLTGDLAAKFGSAYANGIWTDFSYSDRHEVNYSDAFKMTAAGAIEQSGGVAVAVPGRHFRTEYDAGLNPTKKVMSGGAATYARNNLDQITAVTSFQADDPDYDQAGNLSEDATWYYDYDGENRLWRIRPKGAGSPYRYTYDYLGRRVKKEKRNAGDTAAEETTKFLYDGWSLVAELDGGNGVLRSYTWGIDASGSLQGAGGVGGLLAFKDHGAGKIYYPLYDASHNIIGWADSGNNGAIVAACAYTPFGEKLPSVEDSGIAGKARFGFSTKYTDPETGLVYYGLRYYSAKLGRFINRDPIEEAGGVNLYALAGNDPVDGWDYLGLDGEAEYEAPEFNVNSSGGCRARLVGEDDENWYVEFDCGDAGSEIQAYPKPNRGAKKNHDDEDDEDVDDGEDTERTDECEMLLNQILRESELGDKFAEIREAQRTQSVEKLRDLAENQMGISAAIGWSAYNITSMFPWGDVAADGISSLLGGLQMERQLLGDTTLGGLAIHEALDENAEIDLAVNIAGVGNSLLEVSSTVLTSQAGGTSIARSAGKLAKFTPFVSVGTGFYGLLGTSETFANGRALFNEELARSTNSGNALDAETSIHNMRAVTMWEMYEQKGCNQ